MYMNGLVWSIFQDLFKNALKLTGPSGFKSGLGVVQLNPISWDHIGGLHEVKKQLKSAVSLS